MGYDLATMTTSLATFGLNWLLQSSALLGLGLAAGRSARGRGPAVQSAVYRTTLAAVLVCPIASALLGAAGFDGFSIRLPAPEPTVPAPVESRPIVDLAKETPRPNVDAAFAPPMAIEEPPPVALAAPAEEIVPAEPPAVPEAPAVVAPPGEGPGRFALEHVAAIGLAAWGLGLLFFVLRLAIEQRRMRRLRASAAPAGADAESLCRTLATRMGVAAPSVWRSPFLFSPCLDGLRRPAILLPDDHNDDLHDAFVHELAHLARRDGLWNLARRLATAVLWFQPLLWILSRRLEATAEDVCDDYVVHFGADRARYAGLLVEFAGRALPPRSPSAVGMISFRSMLARRVVRILDTSRSLSTRAGRKAILATLIFGLASTTFAGLLGVGGRDRVAVAEEARNLGTSEATTGESIEPPKAAETPAVDIPITGRVVDLEGRPVAGVVVTVERVNIPKGDDLAAWIEGVKKGDPSVADQAIDWYREAPEAKGRKATTDAGGRFRIDGLGAERVVRLSLQGEAIACDAVQVVLRKTSPFPDAPFPDPGYANHLDLGSRTIYGADFIYAALPGRAVEGVIRDAKTSEPLAGAGVRSYRFAGSDFLGFNALKTTTDAQGRFRLNGFPRGKGNALHIVPNDEQPYFARKFDLPDPEGTDPIRVDVPMHKGIWIEGRITDRETGEPVPDAWLHYMPFLSNTFAQATPEFGTGRGVEGGPQQDRYVSKTDGSFRLVGLPGRAIVGAAIYPNMPVKQYMRGAGSESIEGLNASGRFETYSYPGAPGRLWPTVMKEIDPPADATSFRVDLRPTAGDSVRVRIAAPDGQPVNPVKTIGRISMGFHDRDDVEAAETVVQHLYTGEERTAAFLNEDKHLGKVVRVKKGDDAAGPVPVALEPLAKLTGVVLDEDGAPVSGARIRPDLLPSGDFSASLPDVYTDAKGRFVVSDVPTGCDYGLVVESPGSNRSRKVAFLEKAVVKPGETTDVGEIRFGNRGAQADQTAKPPADVPIAGRIVDLEGLPVAGVVVTVEHVNVPKGGDLTAWIEGVEKGEAPWIAARVIDWDRKETEAKGRKATTDADGRFRFDGLGAECVVGLSLRGETIAYDSIEVVSRKTAPFPAKGFPNQYGAGSETIYGADFTYSAAPGRAVEGVVKDAKTGEPLADAGVWSNRFAGSDFVGTTPLKTTTDARGRFQLTGLPKGKGNELHIVPNDEQPYFMREFELPDPEGTDPIRVEIPAHRGIWIEGRITDRETGEPVPDARLHYLPFLSNTFAQATPEFDKDGNVDGTAHQDRYKSKADGSFRLVGLPGRAIVGAVVPRNKQVLLYMRGSGSESIAGMGKNSDFETYRNPVNPGRLFPTVMKEIDPPADATSFRVDLQPTAGDSVRVRIAAPDRGAVKLEAIGRDAKGSYDREPIDAPEVEIRHLYPGEERMTAFRDKDKRLGKVVRVKKGDDDAGPMPVALEPLAKLTGVVLDEDGAPVPGARIRPDLLPSGDYSANLEETSTDEKGRFIVPDVPTGCDYGLVVESLGPNRSRKVAFLEKAVVKPGETTDVGEIRFGEQPTQAAKPPAAGTPITGRVVDLEGRPVAGVVVKVESVKKVRDGGLSAWLDAVRNGETSFHADRMLVAEDARGEATTDADGRFRIEGLGADRVVELSLTSPGLAFTMVTAVTHAMKSFSASGMGNRYGPGPTTIHGPDFTFSAEPSRPVEGLVKDAKTGRPLAGVEIHISQFAGSSFGNVKAPIARTDDRGRFQLVGIPRRKGTNLLIVPNDEQPYFIQFASVPYAEGAAPAQIDAGLHEGIWIEGKLTERRTGKPVSGARLYYFPYRSNPFAQTTPEFGDNPHYIGGLLWNRYMTKDDGSFRIVGLPGKGVVGADASVERSRFMPGAGLETLSEPSTPRRKATYENRGAPGPKWPTVMKEIDPPADARSARVDLEAVEGDSVRIRAVDADGRPVSGLEVIGLEGMVLQPPVSAPEPIPAECEVVHLRPEEQRTVVFRHAARKLGKVVRVTKGDDADGPVVVALEPLATIAGRVVDAAGAGAPNVKVLCYPSEFNDERIMSITDTATTDGDGRFLVENLPVGGYFAMVFSRVKLASPTRAEMLRKIPVQPGRTTDVGAIEVSNPAIVASKNAEADATVTGRIVDLEGRPVAGAVVKVQSIKAPTGGDLTAWIDLIKRGEKEDMASRQLQGERPGREFIGVETKTDAEGRFRIEGLPSERVVELSLAGESISYQSIRVVTRKIQPFAGAGLWARYGPGPVMVHGSDFTYSATPGRLIEGVVKDAKTGRPLEGLEVQSDHFAGANLGGIRDLTARTDSEGRFRLAGGMPKGKGNQIEVVPTAEQPYFTQDVPVPDPVGLEPVAVEIVVHEGIWIEGKLTDQRTGKPIPETRVYYFPFRSNGSAQAIPGFGGSVGREAEGRFTTKADGSFRLVGLPGRAIVGALVDDAESYMQGAGSESIAGMNKNGRFETYINPINPGRLWPTVMKEIDPPADARIAHVDLQATAGASVRVRVVGPDGRPSPAVASRGRTSRGTNDRGFLESSDTLVSQLRPDEVRKVMFLQLDRKLGKTVRVKEGDDAKGPVVVALEPLATIAGRVVDADGAASPGASIMTLLFPPEDYPLQLGEVSSDANGRFAVTDVPIGAEYGVYVRGAPSVKSNPYAKAEKVVVKPGETTDVGELRLGGN